MKINASTQRYGIFGNPVGQSLSPVLQNAWIKDAGINAVYLAFEPKIEDFGTSLLDAFKKELMGANITAPFKGEAAKLCDIRSIDVEIMGAANTLKRGESGKINGINTDGIGLVLDLDTRTKGWREIGRTINIIGAGGAAAGVIAALSQTGARNINIIARNLEKAEDLIARAKTLLGDTDIVFKAKDWKSVSTFDANDDIIINATTIGLKGDGALELDLSKTPEHTIVYDMIYSPNPTHLMTSSANQKRQTLNGLGMLVGQAVFAFENWFGIRPDFSSGLERLKEHLK